MFDTYGAPTVAATERLRGYKSVLYLADTPEVSAALQAIAPGTPLRILQPLYMYIYGEYK